MANARVFNNTATLTIGPDVVNFGSSDDNAVYAPDATLSAGDTIEAGSGGGNTLFLTGTGTFDLTLPAVLTGIATVDGDPTANQTIFLRAGLPVTLDVGSGNDTVTIANTADNVQGGSGDNTINVATNLLGATLSGSTNPFASLNITDGSAASATLGANITNFGYVDLFTSNFALNLGSLDAPTVFITGDGAAITNDSVVLTYANQTVTDYTGNNTITFAGGTETLVSNYFGDGNAQPGDTLLDFNSTDTIDLPSLAFNTASVSVTPLYDPAAGTLDVQVHDTATGVYTDQYYTLTGLFTNSFGFSTEADASGNTQIVYTGAVFETPANPTPTQPVYYVPALAPGSLVESNGIAAGTSVLFPGSLTLQGLGLTTSNNTGNNQTDVVAGGKLYLLEQGLLDGTAIYVSDGTPPGTTLLTDLGAQQALAANSLGAAGSGDLAFLTEQHTGTAADAASGGFNGAYTVTLWTSNGTASGTTPLASFASTTGELPVTAVYKGSSAGQYYFVATTGAGDNQMFATNAAGTGVSALADLGGPQQPTDFHAFAAGGATWSLNGVLYVSDGTAAGTGAVLGTSNPGTGSLVVEGVLGTYNNDPVIAFGYFGTGNTVNVGIESGGKVANLGSIDNASGGVGSDSAVQVGTGLLVTVGDTGGFYLSDGTHPVVALTPAGLPAGATFSPLDLATPGNTARIGGLLYFFGDISQGGTHYEALFSSDGTAGNTKLVDDLQLQAGPGSLTQLTAAGDTLYFTASLTGGATYLMRSDGTDPAYPVANNGTLFFQPGGLITGPLTADTPVPTPGTFTLTTGTDNLVGTPYNDTFTAATATLTPGDVIEGNGGLDTLVLSGAGTFDLSAPATLTGITEVVSNPGGVSGTSQAITLRNGTAFTVRVADASLINGAANSDTVIGTSLQTFGGAYTTVVHVGGTQETIDVSHAIVDTSSANAGALLIGPSALNITDTAQPIVLNAADQLSGTILTLAGASNLSIQGAPGNFHFDNFVRVQEATGGNTIALGDNGSYTIDAAGTGGDTIDEAGSSANYGLVGTTAQLQGDTINGIAPANVGSIDITDMNASLATRSYGNGTLTVTDGTHTDTFFIPYAGATSSNFHLASDGGSGTIVTVTCYAEGTRLRTPSGEMPVETLRPGDPVLTEAGAARPVRWVGRRHIDLTRHPRPDLAQPIRIRAGAVASGVPQRDLLVSPDHALWIDGALIPARLLLNGASVVRETRLAAVTYFHVELDSHDLVLAEGLAAETYLDTGNRDSFENGGGAMRLHPDFAGMALDVAPEIVAPRSHALAARAGVAASPAAAHTTDAAPIVIAGDRRIRPVHAAAGRLCFPLPPGATRLRLVSRAAEPSALRPWLDDRRRLGIAVTRLRLHGGASFVDVALDGPHLAGGWWDVERTGRGAHRWTDGDAVLILPKVADHGVADYLEVSAFPLDAYPLAATEDAAGATGWGRRAAV